MSSELPEVERRHKCEMTIVGIVIKPDARFHVRNILDEIMRTDARNICIKQSRNILSIMTSTNDHENQEKNDFGRING